MPESYKYTGNSATLEDTDAHDPNRELLSQIRHRFAYLSDAWREAKAERNIDLKYLQGDPWDPLDRAARKENGRPCLNQDELNQYVNQAVNNVRQNKREMKVSPDGDGATTETANLQEDLLRTIQKNSRASNVYCKSFQDMVEGSYGFFRIGRKRKQGKRDQYITIKSIANPDSVLFDCDCKEPDWSDGRDVFILDPVPRKEFGRRWPKATKTDFSSEDARVAQEWLKEDTILVCEYWHLEEQDKNYSDDAGDWSDKEYKLYQCFTNGIEILSKSEQPGQLLPIIPMFGLERWLNKGGGPKREINSLVRLARDPQMGLAYAVSQQAEEMGMTPKAPYEGFVGQFETDEENIKTVTKVPHAYIQFDPVKDEVSGQVLPRPNRVQFTPNIQAYEVGIDSKRRAVQSAMGITPLPTATQRDNQKSGVALERVTQQTAIGSYHFVDKFEMALDLGCRVILGWMGPTYDAEREESLEGRDGKRRLVNLNAPAPPLNEKTQQPEMVDVALGSHTPDITTAPNEQSQQQAVADFVDNFIVNLPNYQFLGPQKLAELLAEAVKMRPELGIEGERIIEILVPQNDQGQQIAQMQQQGVLMQKQMADLAAEIQKLKLEKAGRMLDNQGKKDIEKMKIDADIAKAEIATKAQIGSEREEWVQETWKELHGAAHDVALQKDQQGHEKDMAQQQAAQAVASQQADQSHDLGMATVNQSQTENPGGGGTEPSA